ncbi:MAG: thioredoxin domain-containing protein [Candidatus Gracilibacteria bacterium]|nr:thioredoxin domain-containing protein [Candidatus Gracilibacteria bacterium]
MKKLIFLLLPFLLLSCGESTPVVPQVSKSIESAVFGAPSSKVQLTIFADYECPACIFFEKTVGQELYEKYVQTNKINITYKNFPLPQHKNAERDALAALYALSEGKYWEFSLEMYALEDQKKGDKVTDEERIALGKKVGLDPGEMQKSLDEGWYLNQIAKEKREGEAMGLEGTPSIYLNGTIMKFQSKEEFFGIIEAVLKQ